MNRRSFLSFFGLSIAGLALDKAIPNGRVWSFPKEIKSRHGLFLPSHANDSTGTFLMAELDRLDSRSRESLSAVAWERDWNPPVYPGYMPFTKDMEVVCDNPEVLNAFGAIFQVPPRMLRRPDFDNPEVQQYFKYLSA